ncbi:MAG: HAMP domain-containing histidine kinase [Gemmatimonadetes bacterium]|nr:HAMP domain-containing histidine kinase [Gemmatimonadota bacterium]
MTLRGRFVFTFVAFALLLTAAGGAVSFFFARAQIERELDEKLIAVAGAAADVGGLEGLASGLAPGMEQTQIYSLLSERLRVLQRYVAAAYLFRPDLTVLVSTAPPDSLPIGAPLYFLLSHSEALETAWSEGQATSDLFDVDGSLYKYGFVRLSEGAAEASPLMMAAQIPADYQDALVRLRRTLLLGSIGAAMIAVLLAGLLATRVTGPMDRLSMAALRIQRGRMVEPIPVEGNDEIGRLSRAMERMRVGLIDQRRQMELMVAQVAHEIRNPLGGIELLSSAVADSDDPEERRRVIGKIRGEVTALNDIINDFLEFARPAPATREPHDLRDPIRDAAEIVQAEIAPKDKAIHLELPSEPLPVLADRGHIKRLVLNLMRNGAQAGQNVWVRARPEGERVMVAVGDDGPGVPLDLRERLFEPFVTDKEQGAGLGLAIVKKLAEANAGQLEWDPEAAVPGGGAEFRVYLESAS